jgi:DNA-directed RNA polymerase specialized sigma subunit
MKMLESKRFVVRVVKQLVPVTEEVYLAYYRADRRMRYFERDIKTESAMRDKNGNVVGYRPAKEDSLERLMENGADYADENESAEDILMNEDKAAELYAALNQLDDGERALIDALFFSNTGDGMSEREYAAVSGIPRKTLAYRRELILSKLKKLIRI